MHKPILRRVGLVLVVVSLLQLAWVIYRSTQTHGFAFDFTFLVGGICLMFGSLRTARFIRGFAAIGFLLLIALATYLIATEPFASTMEKLSAMTVEEAGDLIDYIIWAVMLAWTFRELIRPEILADQESGVALEQRATSATRQVRYRRARADP